MTNMNPRDLRERARTLIEAGEAMIRCAELLEKVDATMEATTRADKGTTRDGRPRKRVFVGRTPRLDKDGNPVPKLEDLILVTLRGYGGALCVDELCGSCVNGGFKATKGRTTPSTIRKSVGACLSKLKADGVLVREDVDGVTHYRLA